MIRSVFINRIPVAGALTLLALLVSSTFGLVTPASAQQVVARVNGEPITAVDVAQRTRLTQISGGGKTPSRQQVLDELIDEQIKLQTARRYRIEVSDSDVERVVAGMAGRMRTDSKQFAQALGAAGISINALKRKLRADLAWNNIVRGKFQASLQLREKDVLAAAEARRKDGKESIPYQYTLRPILLVVPRGAGDNAFAARRREAEGLRTRFQSCDEGIRLAKGLRDVAVREPITRTTGDLNAKLREVIEAVPIGRLTPPDVTSSGVEVFAVCEKKALKAGDTGYERDVREEMFGERFQAQGNKYLKQLRRSAMIEIK